MRKVIQNQLERNADANLLNPAVSDVMEIDAGFRRALLALKEAGSGVSDGLIDRTVDLLLDRLYAINQYLHIDPESRRSLADLYRRTFDRIGGENFDDVMRSHHTALAAIVSDRYPVAFREVLKDADRIGRVVNEEYSVDFQTSLFELEADRLAEPFIDIGCGGGALVGYLAELGVEAYGFDRTAARPGGRIRRADWLEYPFPPRSLGTVYSNMAFTNHAVHVCRFGGGEERALYERKYAEILESLRPGGMFLYAPGIESFERAVDRNFYSVESAGRGGIPITRVVRISE